MRTYSVVNGRFWTEMSHTGVEIRRAGLDAVAVALYLVTSPHSTALGLYYLPITTLAHDLWTSPEKARPLLETVCATGFAEYFAAESMIWVPQQAHYQIGKTLKSTDHRRAWALRELRKYEGTTAYGRFLERYGEPYQLISKPASPLRLVPEGRSSPPPSPPTPPTPPGRSGPSRMAEAHRLSQLLDESSHDS